MHQMTRSLAALPLLALLIPQIVLAHGPTAPPTRPVFVYPAAHQMIPYSGSWSFAVRPMKGARGYLWSFVQDGVIRWQNLTYEHRLSGRAYTIASGSTAHRHLHPGWLWVWVQALLPHERWSGVTTLTVALWTPPAPTATPQPTNTPTPQPTNTPPPTATPTPQPTNTPTRTPRPTNTPTPQPTNTPSAPQPGELLYQADWTSGFNGWTIPQGWKTVSGELVNDGITNSDATQLALPPKITRYTPNYAVEAKIQYVRDGHGCGLDNAFGLSVRGESSGDYRAGIISWGAAFIVDGDTCRNDALTQVHYPLDTDWHTYRVEVHGNDIKLLIDGYSILETTDNHHLTSNSVGLWSNGTVINVHCFKVTAL
jgi:hypothetical protein